MKNEKIFLKLKNKIKGQKELSLIFNDIYFNKGNCYSFINPFSYNLIRLKKYNYILSSLDGFFIDGVFLVYMLKLVGIHVRRYSFDNTSVGALVFDFCEKNNKTIFFIGSKENEIKKSILNIKEKYPELQVLGYNNGYFDNVKKNEIISNILKLKPDFVIVGMGAIFQENFLIDLKKSGFKGIGFSCGGFLHQSANNFNYFPVIINKLHLRWFFRMVKEKGIFKRNLITYPKFFFNFIKDMLY